MSYQVIARKYRPQTFEDVVGQQHVVETLRNAIRSGRVAHAYLFSGPRGTGKTSSARIFAKALNCEQGPTLTPCNTCRLCREITDGNSLDVMEIDGASNNGVEQVRTLRDNVRFLPAAGRFKIYIIDEVHMLSIAAFNALLKTLEEPPAHVKFLFATTESAKVPITILSRCQRFDLKRIPTREIAHRLREICEAEKIEADDGALVAVARGADGGMRDAQSALDQLIAFQGGRLTEQDVLGVFGLVSHAHIHGLAAAIVDNHVPALLEHVARFDETGKDLFRVLVDLLEHLRNVLVFAYSRNETYLPDLSDAQIEEVKELAARVEPRRLVRVVELLMEAEQSMRSTLSKRTVMEMALIRSGRAAENVTLDEVLRQLHALRAQAGGETGEGDKKKVAEATPKPPAPSAPSPARAAPAPARPAPPSPPPDSRPPPPPPPASPDPAPAEPAPPPPRSLQAWAQDPKVRLVMDTFNGDILDVRV
jgi:DNA polymerase-3 subunit gamma/tau